MKKLLSSFDGLHEENVTANSTAQRGLAQKPIAVIPGNPVIVFAAFWADLWSRSAQANADRWPLGKDVSLQLVSLWSLAAVSDRPGPCLAVSVLRRFFSFLNSIGLYNKNAKILFLVSFPWGQ